VAEDSMWTIPISIAGLGVILLWAEFAAVRANRGRARQEVETMQAAASRIVLLLCRIVLVISLPVLPYPSVTI
jgi:hypothetical protein